MGDAASRATTRESDQPPAALDGEMSVPLARVLGSSPASTADVQAQARLDVVVGEPGGLPVQAEVLGGLV
jgi:hypothetical protein